MRGGGFDFTQVGPTMIDGKKGLEYLLAQIIVVMDTTEIQDNGSPIQVKLGSAQRHDRERICFGIRTGGKKVAVMPVSYCIVWLFLQDT